MFQNSDNSSHTADANAVVCSTTYMYIIQMLDLWTFVGWKIPFRETATDSVPE